MDAVKEFSEWPRSWHLIGRSRDFGNRPRAVTFGTKRLLVVRNRQGKVHALNAHCSHMGADLIFGRFDGEVIRCPMHGWAYDLEGACVNVPDCAKPPRFAKQQTFSVVEVHGVVCVFDGSEPDFPLPFFDDETNDNFKAASPLHYEGDAPWFWVAANGFDVRHFRVVHGRRLLIPPTITQSHPDMLRVVYKFALEGRAASDRLLMKVAGPEASLTFTTWRGNVILAEAKFGSKITSRILSFVTPISPLRCTVDMIPLQRRIRGLGPLSEATTFLALALRRMMTKSFFKEEARTLKNLGHTPIVLTPEDELLAQYFNWLRGIAPNHSGPEKQYGQIDLRGSTNR